MSTPQKGLVAELKHYLAGWAADLRKLRDWRNLLDVEGAQSIAADLEARDQVVANTAYTAEQADREAIKLLEQAQQDGLDARDLPLLKRALRNIRRSAEADHQISEALV